MEDVSTSSFDAEGFGKELLRHVRERGLGSIPKREMDLLLLHLIEVHGGMAHLSNGQMSLHLRTPETRVRALRYEAALRFGGELRENYRRRLSVILQRARLRRESSDVILVVEDRFVRSLLLSDLKAVGSYADWSFNSEILRVNLDALVEVLLRALPPEGLEEVQRGLGVSSREEVRTILKDRITETLQKIADRGVEEVIEMGTGWVREAFRSLPKVASRVLLLCFV